MKKPIFILFLIASTLISSAQGVRFSFMASPQLSWFNTESKTIENNGIKTGIRVGLQVDNFFAQHYAFTSGIFLSSTGGKLRYIEKTPVRFKEVSDSIPAGAVLTYHLNYFSIPLGLKLTTREIGYSTFFVNLGINTDLRFKAKADLPSLDYSRELIPDEIALFRFSYYLGTGIKYSIGGNTALIGGITYHGGINNVLSNEDLSAVINTLTIQIGILF
jgi:hypothetical protein